MEPECGKHAESFEGEELAAGTRTLEASSGEKESERLIFGRPDYYTGRLIV
jgi:hypothetical protein